MGARESHTFVSHFSAVEYSWSGSLPRAVLPAETQQATPFTRPGLKTTVRSGGIPAAHPTVKDAANGSGGRDPQVPVSHPAVKDAAGGSGGNDPEVAIGSAKPRGEALRGPWGHRLLQHPLRLLQQSLTLGDPDPQHPLQHPLKHLPVARLQRQLVSPTRPAPRCPWGPRPAASSAAAAAASRKAAAAAAATFRRTRPNQQRTLDAAATSFAAAV